MAGKINVNYIAAAGASEGLTVKIAIGSVEQDGVSNLVAVTKGYTQGKKGIHMGGTYEGLLRDDAAKIKNLAVEYENFDREVANSFVK